ncbi:MAG: terpene cyclase/mutase family protein [Planctomycetota bacterium]|nr:terpene cyclase/mutase family protein [Planctomycetota bacterium]
MSQDQASTTTATPDVQSADKPKRGWIRLCAKICGVLFLLLCAVGVYLWQFEMMGHTEPEKPPEKITESGEKSLDAIRRGVEFLKIYQEPDGGFTKGIIDPKPAFTALVVEALAMGPDPYTDKDQEFVAKAVKYILKYQRENGSICTPAFNLDVYSTAVALRALKAQNNPAYEQAIERAKNYLLTTQEPLEGGNPNGGGVGYGTAFGKPSGDVTQHWVEALNAAGVKKDSEAFKNATAFFSRIQNNTETNPLAEKGTKMTNDGGFIYRVGGGGEGKPYEKLDGVDVAQSYGLMSYAGLKSFLFMDVDKNDARVDSAWKWVCRNYTLDENKNIGADGLYYYYMTMAKALAAYGEPIIPLKDETGKVVREIDWAQDLTDRILKLQDANGSWKNKQSSRWKEDDPVMVTAFAIRTLAICRDFKKTHPAPAPAEKTSAPAGDPSKTE